MISLTARYIIVLTAFFFPLALVNILRFSIQGMGFGTLAILSGVLDAWGARNTMAASAMAE